MTVSRGPKRNAGAHTEHSMMGVRTKCLKPYTENLGSCVRLRSGPVFRHPLVLEAATMQVESLSDFQLTPPDLHCTHSRESSIVLSATQSSHGASQSALQSSDDSDPSIMAIWSSKTVCRSASVEDSSAEHPAAADVVSSQSQTVTDPPWSPRSKVTASAPWSPQTTSQSRTVTEPPWSPRSEVGTCAPWSPQRTPTSVVVWSPSPVRATRQDTPVRRPRTPPSEIPRWFAECYESDGYDSDALALIAGLRPPQSPGPPRQPDVEVVLPVSAEVSASPVGRVMTGSANSVTSLLYPSEAEVWVPEEWPKDVEQLTEQWNPRQWRFARVSIGVRKGAGCGCEQRCRATSCLNASESRFCCERNCAFGGVCGNSLAEHPSLLIARSSLTGMRGVVTTTDIPAGMADMDQATRDDGPARRDDREDPGNGNMPTGAGSRPPTEGLEGFRDVKDVNSNANEDADLNGGEQTREREVPGTILTSQGPVDASLASHYDMSEDESPNEAEDSTEDAPSTPLAQPIPAGPGTSSEADSTIDQRPLREESVASTPPNLKPASRAAGRPRGPKRVLVPTVATPSGPVLQRNPQNAAANAREEENNKKLNVISNRLGGQDLRVLRDNLETMAQTTLNDNGKRTPSENSKTDTSSNTPSFARGKRVRSKQRMAEMHRELDEFESKHVAGENEMMRMLMFFQKDTDRRAEADERRRRKERAERFEAEKRERLEREQLRREEAEVNEKRRLQDLQMARELREEQRRIDAERDAKLEREKEENRRIQEERIALDRAEARQRHEQMMMLFSNMQKK